MNISEIRHFEKIASNGHAALEAKEYEGWELRFSKGYTNRINSISILGPAVTDINEAVDKKLSICENEYKLKGLPCIFKLTDADKTFSDYLEKRGYVVVTPTDLMTLDLCKEEISIDTSYDVFSYTKIRGNIVDIVFSSEPDDWYEDYFEFEGVKDESEQELCKKIHSKVIVEKIYIKLLFNGKSAAVASLAIEDGYSLLQNVVVAPKYRRLGFGKKLCMAAIDKSKKCGLKCSYLQVIQDNEAALNLYKKLGYEKVYSYWYMRKGEPVKPSKPYALKKSTESETEILY